MYNLIIPGSLSYIIVPKYCHVGASLGLHLKKLLKVTLLPECQSEIIQLHPDLHPVISLLKNDDGRRASYLSGSSKCALIHL